MCHYKALYCVKAQSNAYKIGLVRVREIKYKSFFYSSHI